jgi:hypothetical protein
MSNQMLSVRSFWSSLRFCLFASLRLRLVALTFASFVCFAFGCFVALRYAGFAYVCLLACLLWSRLSPTQSRDQRRSQFKFSAIIIELKTRALMRSYAAHIAKSLGEPPIVISGWSENHLSNRSLSPRNCRCSTARFSPCMTFPTLNRIFPLLVSSHELAASLTFVEFRKLIRAPR